MACAWENKQRCVEVCLGDIGNYVYVGYESPDPDYSLIEVAKDLSGYSKIALPGGIPGETLYSKRQKVYAIDYDTAPNPDTMSISRHDGAGSFVNVSGTPTGLGAHNRTGVLYDDGNLRAVDINSSFNNSLYESNDGETWTVLAGSVAFADSGVEIGNYITFGSRIIGIRYGNLGGTGGIKRLAYSDDGGATWVEGTGSLDSGGGSRQKSFVQSGSRLIVLADNLYTSTDGATWTQHTQINDNSFAVGAMLAADGTGKVVATGESGVTGLPGVAYSSNHGASWTVKDWDAAGIGLSGGNSAFPYALFWDGAQFVVFVERLDIGGTYQIFTSPTGATWTPGIIIPEINLYPTQIID